MYTKNILIIDDDPDLSMITSDMLEDNGYNVKIANTTEEGYSILQNKKIDLIILDINLPDSTGFDFCKEIRAESTIPIIFISARTSKTDKITGLDIGGDDYISKPYSLEELLSRVNANIRRAYGFNKPIENFTFGNITVDFTKLTVKKNNSFINLSTKEFELLKYFINNKNIALKKEKIFSDVWGIFNEAEISSLAVHIRWLREKLEDNPSNPQYIKTIWGSGYIFEVTDNEK